MNILFLISQMPYPPHQGAAIRNFGLISGLAKAGHKISLLAVRPEGNPGPEDTPLKDICHKTESVLEPVRTPADRLKDLLNGKTDLAMRLFNPAMENILERFLSEDYFDIIHMDIQSVEYLPFIKEAGNFGAIIYDAHNAEYDLQRRIAQKDIKRLSRIAQAVFSFIQAARLENSETMLCEEAKHIFACSDEDGRKLRMLDHETPITTIPNAIDVSAYHASDLSDFTLEKPAIVFTGKMDYRPNVDAALYFAEEIFPIVLESIPQAHFYIVGQRPHDRLNFLKENPNITITGFVDDIIPYITQSDVYVAPLRMGSGTRFKLLESMALGCKIVSTSIGAEGLGIEDGYHLIVADNARDFAKAIIGLIKDPEAGNEMAGHGREFVSKNFDWNAIIPRVESAYKEALSS